VVWIVPEVIESRTCLLPMISEWSRLMVRLWGHYRQHVLPFAGGLMDQPASFMEAMEIIEGTNNRLQQEKLEHGRDRIARRHHR
jgi:hypothetical protein